MELKVRVTWSLNKTKDRMEAWLPHSQKPAIKVHGKQTTRGEVHLLKTEQEITVFSSSMQGLINRALFRDIELDMTFRVAQTRVYNSGEWFNNSILATWTYNDEEYEGRIATFNLHHQQFINVNPPQWKIEGKHIPILSGSLIETFKSMVEHVYRTGCEEIGRRCPECVHQGFCSRCWHSWTEGEDRSEHDADHLTYGCDLNMFKPFDLTELTEDHYEKLGYSHQGDKLKSNLGDSRWAWTQDNDRALSHSELMRVGRMISEELELHFADFEFLYDDVLYIEHFSKLGVLDSITDLDEAIQEYRDRILRKLQRRYAKLYPDYSDLFLQQATVSHNETSHKAQTDMALEEVGEKAHTVSMSAFLDTHIYAPCGLGVNGNHKKDGSYGIYRFQGYDVPTEPMDLLVALLEAPEENENKPKK